MTTQQHDTFISPALSYVVVCGVSSVPLSGAREENNTPVMHAVRSAGARHSHSRSAAWLC
eukprot:3756692-Rhodomonas_salina.1